MTISSEPPLTDASSMPTSSCTLQPVDHAAVLAIPCDASPSAEPLAEPDLAPDRLSPPAPSDHRKQFVHTNQAQIAQIRTHHKWMLRVSCEDVTLDEAARDWIRNHAALWRSDHEARTA